MEKPSNSLIGIAGVHHVVSELSRRGMVALPTVRNTAGYDIVVSNPSGTKYATIQVKASSRKVNFFLMPTHVKVNVHRTAYYVFLRWLERESRYECFLLTGSQTKEEVRRGEEWQKNRIKQGKRRGVNPSVYVGPKVGSRVAKWKRQWDRWTLKEKTA